MRVQHRNDDVKPAQSDQGHPFPLPPPAASADTTSPAHTQTRGHTQGTVPLGSDSQWPLSGLAWGLQLTVLVTVLHTPPYTTNTTFFHFETFQATTANFYYLDLL